MASSTGTIASQSEGSNPESEPWIESAGKKRRFGKEMDDMFMDLGEKKKEEKEVGKKKRRGEGSGGKRKILKKGKKKEVSLEETQRTRRRRTGDGPVAYFAEELGLTSPVAGGAMMPGNEDDEFKYFFRVSKGTFEYICSLVRQDLISRPPSGLINIEGRLLTVEKQVAIALRRLASGESQVSVGSSFGVGQSTVSQVTWRFIESMEERARHHLKWPDQDRMDHVKTKFETFFGLSNCCGAIDSTHIIMTLPALKSSDDWCDQERNYSMPLQGIVDHEMRFLDIVTGWPGSMTTSHLLKCSGFYKLCQSGRRLNGPAKVSSDGKEIREFIVGDSAYPLLPWLITPYGGKCLLESVASFNMKHKSARKLALQAFAQLKGCWRILHKVIWRPDTDRLPSIIFVCCLLHNIIIDTADEMRADVPLANHHDAGYKEHSCQDEDPQGKIARDDLLRHLDQSGILHVN